ncbi:MAG: metallophosphoesterase [Clostridia bacterium]|nr:metallophosphoesterase [Clostridia bacterium]
MKVITKRMRLLIIIVSVLLLLVVIFITWGTVENNSPVLTKYTVKSDRLPEPFRGYKIAQVSDLHNAEIGDGNKKVLSILRSADPDIIVLTGDLIDSRKTKIDVAIAFAKEVSKIAPCYYVSGNHESRLSDFNSFAKQLESVGVTVLKNQKIRLEDGDEYITLIGIEDPAFYNEYPSESDDVYMQRTIEKIVDDSDGYSVVLSHRPELLDVYAECGLDLVFSGHAHGGQFILPLIGGLYAPGQGFFPKYTQGVITKGNTNLVISRGVGNSAFPLRINNRPEVVLVELQR